MSGGNIVKIDFSYIGAMAARHSAKRTNQALSAQLAGYEIEVVRNGQAYKLTISDEIKEVQGLVQMSLEEFRQKNIDVENADPGNIFSYRLGSQWLVFSQYLHEAQFYDSLSNEDVQKFESMLKQITDGTDSLMKFAGVGEFGVLKKQLNSYEAQIEFASSVAALRHFSETFLAGDVKAGFNALIEDYLRFNKKRVMEHQSIEERFYAARAKIAGLSAPLTYGQKRELDVTNKLASTVFTETEIAEMIQRYEEMFAKIKNEKDIAGVLKEAKELLIAFVTKGISPNDSHYAYAQKFVAERAEDTFLRMEQYWKMMWN